MANEKDLWETHGLQESVHMLSISCDFLLSFSSGFSMTRKINNNGIEWLLKKTFLITPGVLSSSCSMDEEDCLPFL